MEDRFDWQEVQRCGDYAFEWGYILGKERDRGTGRITEETHQVMRILQREEGGGWKVHRTIAQLRNPRITSGTSIGLIAAAGAAFLLARATNE